MHEYSKTELDYIVKFLDSILIIDPSYYTSVKTGIKQSMNMNYKDETIDKKIYESQNLRDSLYLLDKHINNFMGIVFERIEMFNYNYLKNNGKTITLTNPDSTSKSDLIHIHDKQNYSFTSCGPDVKFGSADYVVDQYIKKHLMNVNSNGFIDITGYLNPENYTESFGFKTLNRSQNAKVLKAIQEYGYKPTIPSVISRMEFHRIFYYYINYMTTSKLPSEIEISDLSEIVSSVSNNGISKSDITSKLCVDQSLLPISEIPNMTSEIKKLNSDHINNSIKTTQTNQKLKKINQHPIDKHQIQTLHEKVPFIKKLSPKKIILGILGLATVAGALYTAKNPKARKSFVDFTQNLLSDTDKKKVSETITSHIIENVPQVKTVLVDIAEGIFEKSKPLVADSVSLFREALNMYKDNLITKEQFFELVNEIGKKVDKDPLKYLRLLSNFFNDGVARELLESLQN